MVIWDKNIYKNLDIFFIAWLKIMSLELISLLQIPSAETKYITF